MFTGFQIAAYLITVHFRHQDVQQDKVGRFSLHSFECDLAIQSRPHQIALLLQHLQQYGKVFRRIINDQDVVFLLRLNHRILFRR